MEKIRVVVEVADGIAEVYTDRLDELDVVVVDHDTEGIDPSDLLVLAGDTGREGVLIQLDAAERGPEFEAYWASIKNAERYVEDEEPDA